MTRLILTFLLVLAAQARATVLFSDAFDYPDGALVGAVGSPWVTHSGTSGQVQAVGGEMRLVESDSEDIHAQLAAGTPTVFYAGFKLRFTALPGGVGSYFASFKGSAATAFRGKLFASTNGAAEGNLRLAIANGANATVDAAALPTDLSLNTSYQVVLHYDVTAARTKLWLNPAVETDPGVDAADTASAITITGFAFRQPASGATGIGTVFIDDLRVATTFDEALHGGATGVVVSVGASDPTAFETGPDDGVFTITRTGDLSGDLPVNFQLSGSAKNGTDYETLAGLATIPSGQASTTVTVVPIDDSAIEPTETVILALGPDVAYTLGIASATVTIADNDTPPPMPVVTIAAADAALAEAGLDPASFTVTRTGDTNAALDVALEISGTATAGADYVAINLTLMILAGEFSTTAAVSPLDDALVEGSETIVIAVATNAAYQVGTLASATLTLADDDVVVPPALVLDEPFAYPDGALVGAAASPWVTHSGTTGEVNLLGGEAELTDAEGEDVNAPLTGAPFTTGSGSVLYAGFDLLVVGPPTSSGSYFASFRGGTTQRGRVVIWSDANQPGTFRLGVGNAANGAGDAVSWPGTFDGTKPLRVVLRYEVATALTRLWVDPQAEADASIADATVASAVNIGSFALRQAAGIGTLHLDNLKVGTAFDVVAGGSAPAVRLSAALLTEAGEIAFTLEGQAGQTYELESCAELPNWSLLRSIQLAAESEQVKIPLLEGDTQFFRVKLPAR